MESLGRGESPPLHIKNPLHYSYNSKEKPGIVVYLHMPISYTGRGDHKITAIQFAFTLPGTVDGKNFIIIIMTR